LAPYCFEKGKNSTLLPVEDQKRYNREILYHYPIIPLWDLRRVT
jgi:hypothetical protein